MRADYQEPLTAAIDGDGVLDGLTFSVDDPSLADVVLDPFGVAPGHYLRGKGVVGIVHVTASGTNSAGQPASGTVAVNLTAPPPPAGSHVTLTEGVAVPVQAAPPPPPPPGGAAATLETFSGQSIRTCADGVTPLWAAIIGENPDQSGTLNTTLGVFQLTYGTTPTHTTSGPYQHFFPKSGNSYVWPNGYCQRYIEGGTWDANCNRLGFWVKPNKSVPRRPDGGDQMSVGTYVRPHVATDYNWQGVHYYHGFDQNWHADRWHYCEINRVPNQQVGQDPYLAWPEDPEGRQPTLLGHTPQPGTVSLTNGSPVVTLTGGDFNTVFSPGAYVRFAADPPGVAYKILTIDSPTQVTLGHSSDAGPVLQPYDGPTAAGVACARVAVLPTPMVPVGKVPDPVNQVPTHYFDGLTRFYFDIAWPNLTPAGDGAYDNSVWLFDDYVFRAAPNECEELVSAVCCVYTGADYEVSWAAVKGQAASYTVYYSTTASMKSADGSYDGSGTGSPPVTIPDYGYRNLIWSSPAMAEADAVWFFVQPAGSPTGYEIAMVRRP